MLGALLVLGRGARATRALLARCWLLVRSRRRPLERLPTGGRVRVLAAEHRTRPARATRPSGVRTLLDRALAGRTRLWRTVLLRHALVRGGRVPVPRTLRLAEWLALARSGLPVPGRTLVRSVLLPGVLRGALLVGRLLRWPRRTLGVVAGLGVRLLWLVHRAPPPVGADA
ncbi:hypothetical protein SAMN04489726_3444 [Allokutzneria albata]|uniref:Uncharacterized protein n=1 Tax=Allokutzneria albata TaxID=211114 RepID=A0A1G9W887_ALLAB|nr:hypothetical protein SAMN04489726_3444 [Allokutzneria albata]